MAQEHPASGATPPSDLTIRVLKTDADLAAVESFWRSAQHHPSSDYDAFLPDSKADESFLRPHVLAAERGGRVVALLVGRLHRSRLELRLGYRALGAPRIKLISLIHEGWLGDVDAPVAAAMVRSLLGSLRGREADAALFNYLPRGSPLLEAAAALPPRLCRDRFARPEPHWRMTIPATFDEFMARQSKKRRHDMERVRRQLETRHPKRVAVRIFTRADEADRLFEDVEQVARQTYLRQMGLGFDTKPETLGWLRLRAGRGWLRAYVLYVDDVPRAYWLGTIYDRVFYLHFTGYDPNFGDSELGTVSLLHAVEDLVKTAVAKVVDFGFGTAFYKQRFGTDCSEDASVHVFAPTVRAVLLAQALSATKGATLLAKRVLGSTGLLQKIKTSWRKRLAR